MAKRKPARNAKGQFKKKGRRKANPPKRKRPRRKSPKKSRKRRSSGKGTTVVVRTNAPRRRKRRKGTRRRRNAAPIMPPWAMAAIAAGGVALGVQLVKMFVPVPQLKTPIVSALLGPGIALLGSAMLLRKAKTRPAGYALLGAGAYALTSYATVYAGAMWAQKKEGPLAAPAAPNPYHQYRRETRGVPADQKPRLAAGYTSMPVVEQEASYSM
jgi:hypothetical protein